MFLQFSVPQTLLFISYILSGQTRQIDNGADHNLSNSESVQCNNDHKWIDQPLLVQVPVVRKCCPDDANLHLINNTLESFGCYRNNYPVVVNFSIVELYEDCILFINRTAGEVSVENSTQNSSDHEFFPCMYYGDMFGSHVIQNGSLLVTNTYGHFYYRLNNDFCMEANGYNGAYMVCHYDVTQLPFAAAKDIQETNFVLKFLTFISIPCFLSIVILYVVLKELRNLHGIYVISLSFFMAIEFILRSVLHTIKHENKAMTLRRTIQYFDLMNHFWILVLFSNTVLFMWIYLPHRKIEWRSFGICCYGIFFMCCVLIPFSISNTLKEDDIKNLVDFFTTPKTTMTLTYILLIIIIYMGSHRLHQLVKREILQKYYQNSVIDSHDVDMQRSIFQLDEVQTRLTCLTSLMGLMVTMRIFFIPGHYYLMFIRETLKSFQGAVFVMIFIVLRYKDIRTFAWLRFRK